VEIQGRGTHDQDKSRRVWQALQQHCNSIADAATDCHDSHMPMWQKSALGKSLKGGMLAVALP
jgi:hypothetical protein